MVEQDEAQEIVNRVASTVAEKWQPLAKQYGLNREQIQRMEPAFSLAKDQAEFTKDGKQHDRAFNSLAAKENEARQACKAIERAAEAPDKNTDALER